MLRAAHQDAVVLRTAHHDAVVLRAVAGSTSADQTAPRAQRLDGLARRLLTPSQRLARDRQGLAQLARRLKRALPDLDGNRRAMERLTRRLLSTGARLLEERRRKLAASRTALAHLDPDQVLGRGYSIVRDPDGRVRRTSEGLATGSPLDITFAEGGAGVTVKDRR